MEQGRLGMMRWLAYEARCPSLGDATLAVWSSGQVEHLVWAGRGVPVGADGGAAVGGAGGHKGGLAAAADV